MNKTAMAVIAGLLGGAASMASGADLYQALAAVERKDYSQAFELFRELAEIGNAEAQENLAVLYVNGEGVARDNVLGYAWAKLALEQGERAAASSIVSQLDSRLNDAARVRIAAVHAQFSRDALRRTLLPVTEYPDPPADPTTCRMRAAPDPDRFYPPEAKLAGISGEVVVEAKVAEDGSVRLPRALYSFPPDVFEEAGRAVALRSTYTPKIVEGQFVPCTIRFKVKFAVGNYGKAPPSAAALKVIADLRTKAEAGDPNSQLYFGLASGLKPEYQTESDKNRRWFLEAAQAGIPSAQFLVGTQLLGSNTYPENHAKGIRWLELGARNGSGPAMTALASTLLSASRDVESRNQGFDWMRRAAATKHREGRYLFAALLASWPDASKRDPAAALKLMNEIGDFFDYDPLSFEIRAAALAGKGQFPAAKRAQSKAVAMAKGLGWNPQLHQERLRAYGEGRVPEMELVRF